MSSARMMARTQLATILTSALEDAGLAQKVYGYRVGDFEGQTPVVVVSSAGGEWTRMTLRGAKTECLLQVDVFVVYATEDAVWDEEDAEAALDDLAQALAIAVAANQVNAVWQALQFERQSQRIDVELGGVEYARESFLLRASIPGETTGGRLVDASTLFGAWAAEKAALDAAASPSGTNPFMTDSAVDAAIAAAAGDPKYYVALISQTGTEAPTATVLHNTLGHDAAWLRQQQGEYVADFGEDLFAVTKVWAYCGVPDYEGLGEAHVAAAVNDSYSLIVKSFLGASLADGVLSGAYLEVRVYP